MAMPARLAGIVEEFADLAWEPRLGPYPVGQAVSEARDQETTMRGDGGPVADPALPLPSTRPGPDDLRAGVLPGPEPAIHA